MQVYLMSGNLLFNTLGYQGSESMKLKGIIFAVKCFKEILYISGNMCIIFFLAKKKEKKKEKKKKRKRKLLDEIL